MIWINHLEYVELTKLLFAWCGHDEARAASPTNDAKTIRDIPLLTGADTLACESPHSTAAQTKADRTPSRVNENGFQVSEDSKMIAINANGYRSLTIQVST